MPGQPGSESARPHQLVRRHSMKVVNGVGLRRGGAVVSARVNDADAAHLQAAMDRSAVRVTDRAAAYRSAGWSKFDPAGAPYTPEQARKERTLYR